MENEWNYKTAVAQEGLKLDEYIDKYGYDEERNIVLELRRCLDNILILEAMMEYNEIKEILKKRNISKIRLLHKDGKFKNKLRNKVTSFLKVDFQCELIENLMNEVVNFKIASRLSNANCVHYKGICDYELSFLNNLYRFQNIANPTREDFEIVACDLRKVEIKNNDKVKEKFDRIVKSFLEYKKYFCGDKRERVRTW